MKALLSGETKTLNPCPFCGGKVKHSRNQFNRDFVDYFNCGKCGACVSFKDTTYQKSQADNPIESWNRRVST